MSSDTTETTVRLRRVQYWINWLSEGYATGRWESVSLGRGYRFQGVASFRDDPDIARLNWPATLISGELMVSRFSKRRNINVYLLANLGPSMAFGSQVTKMDRLATLAATISYSAFRAKDRFHFVGYTDELELNFPEPHDNSYPLLLARAILEFDWRGKKRGGLIKAASSIPARRSLVILISDFLGSFSGLERALTLLTPNHELVPLVIMDEREVALPEKGFGIYPLCDLETGALSYVFLTSAVRKKFAENSRIRRETLTKLFARFGVQPHFLIGGYADEDVKALTKIFLPKRNRV